MHRLLGEYDESAGTHAAIGSCTRSAAYSASTPSERSQTWPRDAYYWRCTPCSTAARRAAASRSTTTACSTCHKDVGLVARGVHARMRSNSWARAAWPSAMCAMPPPAASAAPRTRSRWSSATCKGRMALAHNGNLTNAHELRQELELERRHLPHHQRHRGHRLHHHPGAAEPPHPSRRR